MSEYQYSTLQSNHYLFYTLQFKWEQYLLNLMHLNSKFGKFSNHQERMNENQKDRIYGKEKCNDQSILDPEKKQTKAGCLYSEKLETKDALHTFPVRMISLNRENALFCNR